MAAKPKCAWGACGRTFTPARANQKFCIGRGCNRKAANAKRDHTPLPDAKCAYSRCGRTFSPSRRGQVTCGGPCSARYHEEKRHPGRPDAEVLPSDVLELRRALVHTQRQLARQKERTDLLVEATHQGAREAMIALGPVALVRSPAKPKDAGKPEVALWHMGDWQGAKVTTSYNSDVMAERVHRFADKAERITEIHRADHPVNDAVVVFGGDMIEGLFNYPTQAFEIDATLFTQYTTVSRLMMDVVRRALGLYRSVKVVAEWGNHGRIGSKRDGVPRSDNVDRMCYEFARQMLLPVEKRLVWDDCPEDIQRVEVGAYRALVIHGDEVGRNGFASPMTIVRHANQWRSGAYPWHFRDLYVSHYHTHNEWAMANGEGTVFQTGSPESDNRYARETMAASARPSQRLHFIDPRKGRVSAQYKVWLDD